jgi:nucleotide-binding universal stress UspA family protein
MYKNVLLSVDLDQESSWRKALPTAAACCKAFGARLHVMTVIPDFGMSIVAQYFPEGYEKQMLDAANAKLHAFIKDRVPPDVAVNAVIGHGTIYEEILRVAQDLGTDLIVLASHRPELRDYLLGPNAARVVRHAKISVLVVRE